MDKTEETEEEKKPLTEVLLDACALFPGYPRDTFLRAADVPIYKLHLTDQILEEMRRNLVGKGHITETQGMSLVKQITRYFKNSFVTGYVDLIPDMPVNEKDRHVLAAAVASHSEIIVTQNLKDFPSQLLEGFGIKALSIDDFLLYLLAEERRVMIDIIKAQAAEARKPPITVEDLLEKKLKPHAPNFVKLVQQELCKEKSDQDSDKEVNKGE